MIMANQEVHLVQRQCSLHQTAEMGIGVDTDTVPKSTNMKPCEIGNSHRRSRECAPLVNNLENCITLGPSASLR